MGKRRSGDTMAERHLGTIAARALYWHRFLPQSVRNHYDAEDMIADAVLHVIERSSEVPPRMIRVVRVRGGEKTVTGIYRRLSCAYDPERAREVTWVYHVANNFCRGVLGHYGVKRLSACETVPIEDREFEIPPDRSSESVDAVERVIEYASDRARDLLDEIFSGRDPKAPDPEAVEDLRWAARECSATLDDFVAAYRTTGAF